MINIAKNIKDSSFTTSLYTAGSFALLSAIRTTPIGATSLGISFVMGLLARNHYEVLATLLPKGVKETYDKIYNEIKAALLKKVLAYIVKVFSCETELKNLRKQAKNELDIESKWDFSLQSQEENLDIEDFGNQLSSVKVLDTPIDQKKTA